MVTADLAGHLREINEAHGVAVLLIEQNARLALDLCDRGYVLEAGRIRARGSAAELAGSADVAAAYLGAAGVPAAEPAVDPAAEDRSRP